MARNNPKDLGLTKVSRGFHDLVKDIESRSMAVEAAAYYKQRDEAYSSLNTTRKALYAYVAELEQRVGITQTIKVRF